MTRPTANYVISETPLQDALGQVAMWRAECLRLRTLLRDVEIRCVATLARLEQGASLDRAENDMRAALRALAQGRFA